MEKRRSKKKPISENALDSSGTIDFRGRFLTRLVCLVLILATFAVYWHVTGHDFVNFDDDKYVYENRHVRTGLTIEGIIWAFSSTDLSYWHPLSWFSHMLDCQLYGLRPGMHHLTNLILHVVSAVLLFLVLRWMTGTFWRSAFVAALFALHPLNVNSVAWVTERKNVLSTCFWMLTMLAYVYHCERPALGRYMLILLLFALGLMAKPMLVTLPFVLLLLDYWPLGRLHFARLGDAGEATTKNSSMVRRQDSSAFRLVLEKVPFFILSIFSLYISSQSVRLSGKVISTDTVPMGLRIANGLVSYLKYIGKMFWPSNLSVFYPYPSMVPMWQTIAAALVLVFITALAIRALRQQPYFAVGWLWYLGTLVPVIGLVQAGRWPSMAARFTYVPLIGLFIIVAWGIPTLTKTWRHRRIVLGMSANIILFALMICTWLQVGYWKNSITLFTHVVNVTANNSIAHYNLGHALYKKGRYDDAIKHNLEALRIKPDNSEAHNNLGMAFARKGNVDMALKHLQKALQIDPYNSTARNNLKKVLLEERNQ